MYHPYVQPGEDRIAAARFGNNDKRAANFLMAASDVPMFVEKHHVTHLTILYGHPAQKLGRRHAQGVAGMANSLLCLRGVEIRLGRWWHSLESIRRQADAGALFALRRLSC